MRRARGTILPRTSGWSTTGDAWALASDRTPQGRALFKRAFWKNKSPTADGPRVRPFVIRVRYLPRDARFHIHSDGARLRDHGRSDRPWVAAFRATHAGTAL